MHSSLLITTVAAIGISISVAASCSSSTPETSSDAGSSGSSGTSGTDASSSGTSGTSGTTSSGGDPGKCTKEVTLKACADCCGITKEILDALDEAFVKCACKDTCKTQCADSACAATPKPPQVDDPCDTCLNDAPAAVACNIQAEEDCKAVNAKCNATLTCGDSAKCLEKPGEEGDGG